MAKSKCRNIVVRGGDGRIVVATPKTLAVTSASRLSPALAALLDARQKAGRDLTKALKDDGYDVMIGEETDVSDAGGDDGGNGDSGRKKNDDSGSKKKGRK